MNQLTRRILIVAILALGTAVFVAPTVSAQGEHFTKRGVPVCTDIGTQLRCTGELAGLGNEDLEIVVSADALVQANCVNPGGNEAPGQNKVLREASGTTTIPGSAIKNGRARFTTTTDPVQAPTAEEAGCPNPNWSTRVVAVRFSNVVVTISQGGELLFTCTAASIPENGSRRLAC
ncbi:MAG TPA: hypothetical protein VHI54_08955 [Actinomycetota bacterium]|nr:hypothetical protein [Actinomycetota bacterium]